MRPLFKIGEKVALRSINLSEHNGEYIVEGIIQENENFVCRLTGGVIYPVGGYAYILDTPLVDLIECDGMEALWAEESLRKIQEVGDMGYKELMTSLKDGVLEWN